MKQQSVQELLGRLGFTKYGLRTDGGELLFFRVEPTNLSVLSYANTAAKLERLTRLLATVPDLELAALDGCESFEANQAFLAERMEAEQNPKVRDLLRQDLAMLTRMQVEVATSRVFLFVKRCKHLTPEQVFQEMNRVSKDISEQGFRAKRLSRGEIQRMLALYFGTSTQGDKLPDVDGAQYFKGRGNTHEKSGSAKSKTGK